MGLNKELSFSPLARWLHAGLALGALYQLTTSLVLLPPDEKGSALGHTMMEAHELGGLVVAVIVFVYLIWSFSSSSKHLSSIWVLVDRAQWKKAFLLVPSVISALTGKADLPKPGNSLAKTVEMLGFLVMIIMAATGLAIWVGLPDNNLIIIPEGTKFLMNIHSLVSNLLWVFVLSHVCMVIAHLRVGDTEIKRISPFHNDPEVSNINELMGFTKGSNNNENK